MKKLSTLLLGLSAALGFAQCEILGNSTLNAGETATYSISNELAQCKQCHYWNVEGNTEIIGDNRLNLVQVRARNSGNSTISLQYFSPNGLVKCSKDVVIVKGTENAHRPLKNTDNECDIHLTNFREVRIDTNTIAFFPDTSQELHYAWKVIYSDGSEATSNDKVPQFSNTVLKVIESIQVQAFSKSCYKKFSKTYNETFWKAL